jgi:hypothetical protein
LPRDQIVDHIFFGADGVNVFQSTKNGVTKHIRDTSAPHSIGVHCMAHCINLAIKTLSKLPLVVWIESLLKCFYFYFGHSPKKFLEFIQILKLMAAKANKIFQIVKTS